MREKDKDWVKAAATAIASDKDLRVDLDYNLRLRAVWDQINSLTTKVSMLEAGFAALLEHFGLILKEEPAKTVVIPRPKAKGYQWKVGPEAKEKESE